MTQTDRWVMETLVPGVLIFVFAVCVLMCLFAMAMAVQDWWGRPSWKTQKHREIADLQTRVGRLESAAKAEDKKLDLPFM